MGRVAMRRPDLVDDRGPLVHQRLYHSDPLVRALAAQALSRLKHTDSIDKLKVMVRDSAEVSIYEDGRLVQTTVGEVAAKALSDLNAS